jgi:RNA polymerase sigma-70 factor (ECF subfamily)
MTSEPSSGSAQQADGFASTRWSLVLQARGDRASPEVQEALSRLCSAYWYPLYAFIRRRGHGADDAEDLTQEFLANLLQRKALSTADRGRGRFRTFLLACCQHFLSNQRDRERAHKRGGGRPILSLDFSAAAERYRAEPAHSETPERLFDRRWAMIVLEHALEQVEKEYEAAGKGPLFDSLKAALVGSPAALPYARIGAELQMSEDAVRKAAQRLRARFRIALRAHVADTVGDKASVDDEIRDLFVALAS